jgi:hypothetical protein
MKAKHVNSLQESSVVELLLLCSPVGASFLVKSPTSGSLTSPPAKNYGFGYGYGHGFFFWSSDQGFTYPHPYSRSQALPAPGFMRVPEPGFGWTFFFKARGYFFFF